MRQINPISALDRRGSAMDTARVPTPRWQRYLPYAIGVALILGLALWVVWGTGERAYRVPRDRVTLGTVTRAPFEDYVAVRATAVPLTTRYLTAEQGGAVKSVLAEDGANVKTGQPLIVLTNTPLQLQIASRETDTATQMNAMQDTRLQLEVTRFKREQDLLEIEHKISNLKGDLARDKILLDGNAIAPATYQQEQAEYAYLQKLHDATVASSDVQEKVRLSQLAQLEKTLQRLRDNVATANASLDALTIRAPTDGRLTALTAEIGQTKAQGAVLGQIDSPNRFKLTADVDEFYLGRVVLGQMVLFSLDGRNFNAGVSKIYPQVSAGTFKIDMQFGKAQPLGLRTGQAVDIKLQLGGSTTQMLLPNGPFYQDTGGRWVFVLAPDEKIATRRNVRLGRRNPQYVEVNEGLQVGEKVIVSGYQAFANIDRVEFK
jgi:HlyD family secretion protein